MRIIVIFMYHCCDSVPPNSARPVFHGLGPNLPRKLDPMGNTKGRVKNPNPRFPIAPNAASSSLTPAIS